MIKSSSFTYSKFSTVNSWIMLFMMVALAGCSQNDMSDLNQFITETKSKYEGQVEPLPVITPYESHSYQAQIQRDPFKPSVAMVKASPPKRPSNNGISPNSVRNKEELERYPLSSLVMVGVLNNDGQNWAIIKAPDSSIYRVRKGNYMGENHGKIIKITESRIDLKEIVADGLGGWIERKNKITLSE